MYFFFCVCTIVSVHLVGDVHCITISRYPKMHKRTHIAIQNSVRSMDIPAMNPFLFSLSFFFIFLSFFFFQKEMFTREIELLPLAAGQELYVKSNISTLNPDVCVSMGGVWGVGVKGSGPGGHSAMSVDK